MNEIDKLHLLNRIEERRGFLREATERRVARQRFLVAIKDCAEGGKVALVWSGRDCDGVQYTGNVELADATVNAVQAAIDTTYEWADGPCSCYIERPSVAQGIPYTSRDLVMEAHENGHPHVLRY